jgi:hypothetical protein
MMIFIIPIILGAMAVGTAVVGTVKGAEGILRIKEAQKIGKEAQQRHEAAKVELENQFQTVQETAKLYGRRQQKVKTVTVARFIAFLKKINQRGSTDLKFLDGLEGLSIEEIATYKATTIEAMKLAQGGIQAAVAGVAGGAGATSLATSVGVASTGTAISGLSGAAAWNATLAWLGGGSLAAGGGGMALGTLVLGGIAVGPALAVGGFAIGSQGEKALTEAREYVAQANVATAQLNESKKFLEQVCTRIQELDNLLINLNNQAISALNDLHVGEFNKSKVRDVDKLQRVFLLMKAISEVIKTPILDSQGHLNPILNGLVEKYITLAKL